LIIITSLFILVYMIILYKSITRLNSFLYSFTSQVCLKERTLLIPCYSYAISVSRLLYFILISMLSLCYIGIIKCLWFTGTRLSVFWLVPSDSPVDSLISNWLTAFYQCLLTLITMEIQSSNICSWLSTSRILPSIDFIIFSSYYRYHSLLLLITIPIDLQWIVMFLIIIEFKFKWMNRLFCRGFNNLNMIW